MDSVYLYDNLVSEERNEHVNDIHSGTGRRFRARFTAVDMAGNTTKAPGYVDVVWDTWMTICNSQEDVSPPPTSKVPIRSGAIRNQLMAMAWLKGYSSDDSPFFNRISVPVEAKTGMFVELLLAPSKKKKSKPYRFIAKLSPKSNDTSKR